MTETRLGNNNVISKIIFDVYCHSELTAFIFRGSDQRLHALLIIHNTSGYGRVGGGEVVARLHRAFPKGSINRVPSRFY